MPTYEYLCRSCGHRVEFFQSITERPKRKCPACAGLRLERQIGPGAAILFKGSGFYQTDYRSDSYKKAAEKESSSSKPEAKPEAKPERGGKGGAPASEPKSGGSEKDPKPSKPE